MPLVEELIARVGEAKYRSKMDLSKGFYQVPLAEEDREKTAFVTTGGKFEFTRMPFGFRNAPAMFQRLVDGVLGGLEAFSAPYIDDIIIFSNDCKQHFGHIQEVIGRLQQAGLTAKPAKCQWAKRTLEYLGHVVGNGLVSVPEAMVEALRNYKRPKTKAQLKSFLGLTGYYRRSILNYANYSKPLNAKTKAEAPLAVDWDEVSVSHFSHLCSVLCSACTLHIPSPSDKFVLQTDATYAGIGGFLSVMRDGAELPVAFYSRQQRDPETRYSVTEVECLAVVESVRHFEVYLDGQLFVLQTDHRALEHLLTAKLVNNRLSRWALRLQGFSFTIVYRSGTANASADALSRQDWPTDAGTTWPGTTLIQRGGGGGGGGGTQPHRNACRAATEEHYNLNIDYVYVLAKNRMYLQGVNGQSLIVPGAPTQTSL